MTPPDKKNAYYMRLALRLAAKGQTRPNPMVGALVVRSGRIVGRGFHRKAGEPHAEVIALREAAPLAKGATLYVTLEPCRHTGRTPPCTEVIIKAGVRRVVAAMIDPNPMTRGRGLQRLRKSGIQTKVGILEKEARALNRVFITRVTKRRPFVTAKVAQSLDGKIATKTGESQWISSPPSLRWAHALRAEVDAILVGVETVLKDDPRLTARSEVRGRRSEVRKQPLRVVLDSRLRTPPGARIFRSGTSVLIATTKAAPLERERKLCRVGAEVLRFPAEDGRVNVKRLLRELARREISHLLVEGGGEAIASLLKARAVDRVAFIVAPLLIGGREAPTAFEGRGITSLRQAIRLQNVEVQPLGPDLLVTANV